MRFFTFIFFFYIFVPNPIMYADHLTIIHMYHSCNVFRTLCGWRATSCKYTGSAHKLIMVYTIYLNEKPPHLPCLVNENELKQNCVLDWIFFWLFIQYMFFSGTGELIFCGRWIWNVKRWHEFSFINTNEISKLNEKKTKKIWIKIFSETIYTSYFGRNHVQSTRISCE